MRDELGKPLYNYQSWKKDLKRWEEKSFSNEEREKWTKLGLKINEWPFANYLKNEKKLNPQTIMTRNNLDRLKEEYEEFIIAKLSEEKISNFIQKANLKEIPYEQFNNIEYLTEGGFSKVYQAEWEERNVILKSLNSSQQGLTPEFLQEIANHELF